jgi:dihydrodipicolinate synthase/N-acetylneuraminate lyase
VLRGTSAAALTPLAAGGAVVDEDAFAPYAAFLAEHGLDGLLALGTTGEGVLLDVAERKRVAELFLEHRNGLLVAVHCGAQTTADTVELAEHAAAAGADAVAVIAPPYFAFDADELLAHFSAAAHACAPTPFYVYEFAARSGYAVPVHVVLELRERAANLAGLKVSDAPFEQVRPYLIQGLDVFIGAEGLIHKGLAAGAAGAVSGLAAALPELTIRAVREGTAEASSAASRVREAIQRAPFQSALKTVLRLRGVPITPTVRSPLRSVTLEEAEALQRLVRELAVADAQNTARSTGG